MWTALRLRRVNASVKGNFFRIPGSRHEVGDFLCFILAWRGIRRLRPFGRGGSLSGEVWGACAACDFASPAWGLVARWCLLELAALRAQRFALRRSLGRLRGARQGGAGYGATPDNLMPKPLRGFGPPSTALPPGGKARISVADGAAKLRPAPDFRSCCLRQHSGPPCIPPRSTPKERFQLPQKCEGNASFAAGASLARCAHSGDLPPRRVNATALFRFECYSASANYAVQIDD